MNKVKANWLFIYPIARKRPDSQGQGGSTEIGRLGTAPRAAVWAGAAIAAALLLGASPPALAQPKTLVPTATATPPACKPPTISSCCTIMSSGSYSLNQNVSFPPALPRWTDCIDVMASDVSIDLNGFTILGHIPFALAAGTTGVNATFSGVNNVSVRNGTSPCSLRPTLHSATGASLKTCGPTTPARAPWVTASKRAPVAAFRITWSITILATAYLSEAPV